jgi:hypothetical protein
MSEYTVGDVLPSGATITAIQTKEHPDGSVTETMEATHPSGAVDTHTTHVPAEGSHADVLQKVATRLNAALADNTTWLSNPGPDHEQVQALTRQVNALIRQVLGLFDATTGT